MSRTFKKRFGPIVVIKAGQMKRWKRQCNKRMRCKCNVMLNNNDLDSLILPLIHENGDVWDSPTDGKTQYF